MSDEAKLRRRWRIVGMAFEPPVMESVDWKWFRASSLTWDELRRMAEGRKL